MWRFSRHRHVSPCAGTRRCCTPPPPPSRLIAAKRARAKFPRSLRRRVTDGARGAGGQSSRRARGVFIIYATGHETGFPLVWLSAYDRRTPCNIAVAGRRSSVVVCCARRVHRVPTSIVHACARASVSCPSRLVVSSSWFWTGWLFRPFSHPFVPVFTTMRFFARPARRPAVSPKTR